MPNQRTRPRSKRKQGRQPTEESPRPDLPVESQEAPKSLPKDRPTGFEFEQPIKGGFGGCLHCGYQYDVLPIAGRIAVGFGEASLTRDGEVVFEEGPGMDYSDCLSIAGAENRAAKDPNRDWRIHLVAPLSERHYQRQGVDHWVLYKKGPGFA